MAREPHFGPKAGDLAAVGLTFLGDDGAPGSPGATYVRTVPVGRGDAVSCGCRKRLATPAGDGPPPPEFLVERLKPKEVGLDRIVVSDDRGYRFGICPACLTLYYVRDWALDKPRTLVHTLG